MKTLVLGGVRSGKSRLAECMARESGLPVTYLATATVGEDPEMRRRIQAHRERRPAEWDSVEVPLALAVTLCQTAAPGRFLIVDCLTLWLTNLLTHTDKTMLEHERRALFEVLPGLPGELVLVSNESNMGVIPLGELTRRYSDEAGRLHQDLAAVCDRVVLTVAGLPQILKGATL